MKGYIRDTSSGALIRVPTDDEKKLEMLIKLIKAIYDTLPKKSKDLIDNKLLEVLKHA